MIAMAGLVLSSRVSYSGRHRGAISGKAILGFCISCLGFAAPVNTSGAAFNTLSPFFGTNGAQPVASLILSSNGFFYGTTSSGGAFGHGTVFRKSTTGPIETLASFDNKNGARPFAPLVEGPDGNFYGTATAGGLCDKGTIFVLNKAAELLELVSFNGTNGAQPAGGLLRASNGTFYGTTVAGGAFDLGTVFTIDAGGNLTTLTSFAGTNGAHPYGALARDSRGNLYGTTSGGGPFNAGTIFQMTTNSTVVTVRGNPSGAGPQAGLTLGKDGNLYGTTAGGGTNDTASGGAGTVFRLSADGSFTNLFSFGDTNGSHPFAAVSAGGDGNIYGTTTTGGSRGAGTVFSITPNGTITVLYAFAGGNDGGNPHYSSVTFGTNGNLYGTTSAGGKGGNGTIYQISGLAPFVITNPTNQTVPAGTTVKLMIAAGGSVPLTYQWQMNSNNLSDKGNITGTSSPQLTIFEASTANSGAYTVVIGNGAGSVTSAPIVLTVVDPYGTNRPVVKITNPPQNAFLKKSVITVKGSSVGSVPMSQVYYRLNGAEWHLASSTSGWATWSGTIVVPTGTNFLEAYGLNIVGTPSMTNSVTFVSGITSAPVSVLVLGSGSVSPNYDSQWLELGREFKITAKPKSGFLFSDWEQAVNGEARGTSSNRTLTFTMESNLTLTANFVPNPFVPVSGTYNGLFFNGEEAALESSGYISVKVSSKGTFSGSLQTAGKHFPLHGTFDPEGNAELTLDFGNLVNTTTTLHLDLASGTDEITGTLSNATWTAELVAARAVFDGKENVAAQAGSFTMVLPGDVENPALPGGDSYGTVKIDRAGRIHFAGSLADGTKCSQSATLTRQGQWPFYLSLYGGRGSLLGWVTFGSEGDLSGTVNWIKKPMATAKLYSNGFTNVVEVTGSPYHEPNTGMNIVSFSDALLVLSGGDLGTSITNEFTITSRSKVDGENGFSLKFTVSTGVFRGNAMNPSGSERIPFSGVVLQNQSVGRGYFPLGILSGKVELLPAP